MVKTYIPKLTNLQQGILRLLFVKAGLTLNQRQIANNVGVTPVAVMKALPRLEKENLIILTQDKETKRWSIGLRRDRRVMQLKQIDNLRQIYESGLLDFLEKEFAGATIILFGSYSRGEDIVNSDVDIAIIGRNDKLIDLMRYEKGFERKVSLNFYDSFATHKHLKENLANGIVLSWGFELWGE